MTNKRQKNKTYPAGIDPAKLPVNCNWHSRDQYWYRSYFDARTRRTMRVGGADATMPELWEAMRDPNLPDMQSFQYLVNQFTESAQFKALSKAQQRSHHNTHRIVAKISSTKDQRLNETNRHHWKPPLMQKVIDKIAAKTPTTAHRAKENLSRLFKWGIARGHMAANPIEFIELPKLKPKQRLPDRHLINALLDLAKERSKRKSRSLGSVPSVVWKSLELAFLNRLRGIETRSLTDADILDDGLLCERTKGSDTNVTLWSPRLRHVVDHCIADRDAIWLLRKRPYPMQASSRYLLVNSGGEKITSSGWQSVWRRFLELAIKEGMMTKGDWFGLHDMKRRGTTDFVGTKEEKLGATGLSSKQVLKIYDKSIPRFDTTE